MNVTAPPTLLSPRLELRALRVEDLDALAAIYAATEVMRYSHGGVCEGPRTREQTVASREKDATAWQEDGYGVWAVVDRTDGLLLGVCGFVDEAEIGGPPRPRLLGVRASLGCCC
jgi:RimJ/RimL family protein N-acetyltransferase